MMYGQQIAANLLADKMAGPRADKPGDLATAVLTLQGITEEPGAKGLYTYTEDAFGDSVNRTPGEVIANLIDLREEAERDERPIRVVWSGNVDARGVAWLHVHRVENR